MSNKIYPIGIQNFEKIRKGGYFYIDKTALQRVVILVDEYDKHMLQAIDNEDIQS